MATVSESTLHRVATELQKNNLIKFGDFKLKSGIQSPFYIDLREVQSHPSAYQAVTDAYAEMLADSDETVFLAGLPEAGTPLASMAAYKLGRKLVQPRKVVKDHGTKSSVEGAYQPGDRVILIDDLIAKGDSKLEVIAQIEAAGLGIEKFVVLIDREQGGMDLVRKSGHAIEAAATISSIVQILRSEHAISEEQYNIIIDFIRHN